MARRDVQGRGSRGTSRSLDLNTSSGLEQLAISQGLNPPEQKKPFSALQGLSRVLNATTATISGAVEGALSKDKTVFEATKEHLQKNQSFLDTFKNLGATPETRGEKVALGTAGFIADVVFDPLTYLTFGASAGLKVGSKILSSQATKGVIKAQKTVTEKVAAREASKLTEKELAAGAGKKAQRIAESEASRVRNELSQKLASKEGLSSADFEKFAKLGVETKDLETLRALGSHAIDKGGIKFFKKTIVSSATLAKTPVGKAVKRLGETEIAQTLKNTLGRTFVADFNKNKKLVQIIDKAKRQGDMATLGIIDSTRNLFKGLSDEQLSELAQRALDEKLKIVGLKGAERKAAKESIRGTRLIFDDPKLQEVSDKLFETTTKTVNGKEVKVPSLTSRLARNAGINEEDAIKLYFPSLFRDKLKVKEFVQGRKITSAETGFRKEFTGAQREDLIKNPIEAYGRRQVQVTTARIKTRGAEAVVRNLGKPLSEYTEEEAKRLGFVKFSREGIDGKIEGWIPKSISEELNNFLEPKVDLIDDLAKAVGFDWATSIFKGYVTSLFPAFHIRNLTSNQFLNMMKIGTDVGNIRLQKLALDVVRNKNLNTTITTKSGKVLTLKQVRKLVEKESDIFNKGAFSRIEQFLETPTARGGLNINPLSREFTPIVKGREFGTVLEDQSKLVNVLSGLMEGKTVKEAVKQAEDTLFNYSKLTDFERSVLRRLIPFYTFARKNAEFQIRLLATEPGKVASMLKAIRGVSSTVGEPLTQEDLDGLPNYMLDNLGIKAGANKYGQSQYISGFGLPIEEFLNRMSGDKGIIWNAFYTTLVSSNPLIRFPAEKATGQDFFRDRPIIELTNANDLNAMIDSLPDSVAQEMKDFIGLRKIPNKPIYANGVIVGRKDAWVANPFMLHWLRNIPTSRFQSTIGFVNDDEQTNFARYARFFTGVRAFSIDQEQQKFYKELNKKEELTKFLVQMGVLKTKEIPFQPKQRQSEGRR